MEIASNGDYEKLCVKGRASAEECYKAWERIVKRNNEANGSFEYNSYFSNVQSYSMLVSDYNTIKASLFYLLFFVDAEVIAGLKSKGYNIDTSTKTKYDESISAAMRRSDNLITKIKMKQNEIAVMTEKGSGEKVGFEEVIANLSYLIGFTVDDNISLARYNEYRKIIRKKQEQSKNKSVNG